MNRTILIAVAVVIVVLAVAFVPRFLSDLLNYYRFESALQKYEAENQAGAGPRAPVQDACTPCHGPGGRSRNSQYASLAGQPAAYLTAQLQAFAAGRRASPQMGPLAASLSDRDIKLVAKFFSDQTPVANEAVAADSTLQDQGSRLASKMGCAACHGSNLLGQDNAPRLSGQGEVYLMNQLGAFRTGVRHDPSGAMNSMAASLSAGDIHALGHYLAGLSPPTTTGRSPS
jgi:cytochrome c553